MLRCCLPNDMISQFWFGFHSALSSGCISTSSHFYIPTSTSAQELSETFAYLRYSHKTESRLQPTKSPPFLHFLHCAKLLHSQLTHSLTPHKIWDNKYIFKRSLFRIWVQHPDGYFLQCAHIIPFCHIVQNLEAHVCFCCYRCVFCCVFLGCISLSGPWMAGFPSWSCYFYTCSPRTRSLLLFRHWSCCCLCVFHFICWHKIGF